jgi:hypothetical protein
MKIKDKIPFLMLVAAIIITLSSPVIISATTPYPEVIPRTKITDFEPYKFIAFGDTRNTPEGDNEGLEETSRMISELMEDNDIDFILHVGDMVDSGGSPAEYDTYYYDEMEDIAADLLCSWKS